MRAGFGGPRGLRTSSSQVPPPGGSLQKIQTRVLSVPIQRSPHLHASWLRRPRRTSRGRKLQPPWSDAPPSYTAPLQLPKLKRFELQTRDLQQARQLQVWMAAITHASLTPCLPNNTGGSIIPLVQIGTRGLWLPVILADQVLDFNWRVKQQNSQTF